MKIMDVENYNIDNIHIHHQTKNIHHVTITSKEVHHVFGYGNNNGTSSIQNKSMYEYEFKAVDNDLRWNERRIYQNNKCLSIEYTWVNAAISYPRLFINLKGLELHQIQELNEKLQKLNLKFRDKYKLAFTHFKKDIQDHIEYYIYFNEQNIIFPVHKPTAIKKYNNKGKQLYKKSFSIFCGRHCKSWLNV